MKADEAVPEIHSNPVTDTIDVAARMATPLR